MSEEKKGQKEKKTEGFFDGFNNWEIGIVCGLVFLGLLGGLILQIPTEYSWLQFGEKEAHIGDAIGGMTAPFLNLLSAFLVYKAFRAQIKANNTIQEQIKKTEESHIEIVNQNKFDSMISEISITQNISRENLIQINFTETDISTGQVVKKFEGRRALIWALDKFCSKVIGPLQMIEIINETLIIEINEIKNWKINHSNTSLDPFRSELIVSIYERHALVFIKPFLDVYVNKKKTIYDSRNPQINDLVLLVNNLFSEWNYMCDEFVDKNDSSKSRVNKFDLFSKV